MPKCNDDFKIGRMKDKENEEITKGKRQEEKKGYYFFLQKAS